MAGESANGARDAPRMVPALFHEARKGRYEISIETPQMLTPRGSAATAFEQAARAIAFGKNAVKEYREMERPMAKGAENYYEATYNVTYADPKLVSLVFTIRHVHRRRASEPARAPPCCSTWPRAAP